MIVSASLRSRVSHVRIGLHGLEQLEAVPRAAQAEVEHHAVEVALRQLAQGFLGGSDGGDLDVLVRDEVDDGRSLRFVVLDDEQPLHLLIDELRDVLERVVQRFARDRLLQIRDRAGLQSGLTLAHAADDVHRDVSRVRMVLEPIEHRPPVDPRQIDVERDRVGFVRVRDAETRVALERDESLESLIARHVEQDLGEVRVVLDDEDDAVAGIEDVAIVVEAARPRQVLVWLRGHAAGIVVAVGLPRIACLGSTRAGERGRFRLRDRGPEQLRARGWPLIAVSSCYGRAFRLIGLDDCHWPPTRAFRPIRLG